jgi:hypothetical protein
VTAATIPKANRGSGPQIDQATKAIIAMMMTVGTNQPETWSASRWIGARERCRHHLHDLRQHGVAANLLGARHEAAGLIERAAGAAADGNWSSSGARTLICISLRIEGQQIPLTIRMAAGLAHDLAARIGEVA